MDHYSDDKEEIIDAIVLTFGQREHLRISGGSLNEDGCYEDDHQSIALQVN